MVEPKAQLRESSTQAANGALAFAEPMEIKLWLEWGGAKLLSMRISSPAPQSFRSFWPDYQNEQTAYGYTADRLRAGLPTAKEVDLMDEVLRLPGLITDVTVRRIVNSRALIAPISNRNLYSWAKIAHLLHSSPRRMVILHRQGLREIALRVPKGKADAIRQSIAPLVDRA